MSQQQEVALKLAFGRAVHEISLLHTTLLREFEGHGRVSHAEQTLAAEKLKELLEVQQRLWNALNRR